MSKISLDRGEQGPTTATCTPEAVTANLPDRTMDGRKESQRMSFQDVDVLPGQRSQPVPDACCWAPWLSLYGRPQVALGSLPGRTVPGPLHNPVPRPMTMFTGASCRDKEGRQARYESAFHKGPGFLGLSWAGTRPTWEVALGPWGWLMGGWVGGGGGRKLGWPFQASQPPLTRAWEEIVPAARLKPGGWGSAGLDARENRWTGLAWRPPLTPRATGCSSGPATGTCGDGGTWSRRDTAWNAAPL